MPLADLIPNADALLENWPTEPQVYPHAPGAFDHLLTLDEVMELIDTECLPCRNVRIIRRGHVLPASEYSDNGDVPRPGAIRRYLDEGCSLSVRSLQTTKPALARLHHEVSEQTGYETHFNAYLTPPGEHGLRYHYDPYDTVVFQCFGGKVWPFHRPFVPNVVEEYANFRLRGFTEEEREYLVNTPPAGEVRLKPGDVFWLPRGFPHSPHNLDGADWSLHITFALKQRTLHWAASEITGLVLRHLLQSPEAREGLAPAQLLGNSAGCVETARDVLVGALLSLDLTETGHTLRRQALVPGPSQPRPLR